MRVFAGSWVPLLFWLTVVLMSAAGCSQPSGTLVVAEIYGAPMETSLLRASLRVSDTSFGVEFHGNPLQIEVRLPQEHRGQVQIQVEAIGDRGTLLASGGASTTVAGESRVVVHVAIAPPPPMDAQVQVKVQVTGEGKILSEPPGIDCGSICTATFPMGTKLHLRGRTSARALLAAWSGACTSEPCQIDLKPVMGTSTLQVQANFVPTSCTSAGWCWDNPLPQGHALSALAFAPDGKGWFVGDFGTILRWDGSALSNWDSGTEKDLRGVWVDPGVAYAVGRAGAFLKFDGSKWSQVPGAPSVDFYGVGGVGSDEAWALGDGIWRFTGGKFSKAADLQRGSEEGGPAIWARARDDVWAVGADGSILHFDGIAWKETRGGTGEWLTGVWSSGPDDVWAVGNKPPYGDDSEPVVLRRRGGAWSKEPVTRSAAQYLSSVWGTGPDDVWVCGGPGIRWNGKGWVPQTGACARGGASRSELWSIGGYSIQRRRMGLQWENLTTSQFMNPALENRIWGSGPDDIWVGFLHFTGAAWTLDAPPPELGKDFRGIWGSARGEVWTTAQLDGKSVILHRRAGTWSAVPVPSDLDSTLIDLHGSGPDNVWAVGGKDVLRLQGGAFVRVPGPTENMRSVFVLSPADVWIVNENRGKVLHFDGTVLSFKDIAKETGINEQLESVWASGPSDVWIVGGGGAIVHWDGASFRQVQVEPRGRYILKSVFGTGPEDVWVSEMVSPNASLFRLRDGRFVMQPPILRGEVRLWGLRGGPFVAVRRSGSTILRRDGQP